MAALDAADLGGEQGAGAVPAGGTGSAGANPAGTGSAGASEATEASKAQLGNFASRLAALRK